MLSISKRYIGRETERHRDGKTERQKREETKTYNRFSYFIKSVQVSLLGFAD
jgi:hypothetical protein